MIHWRRLGLHRRKDEILGNKRELALAKRLDVLMENAPLEYRKILRRYTRYKRVHKRAHAVAVLLSPREVPLESPRINPKPRSKTDRGRSGR